MRACACFGFSRGKALARVSSAAFALLISIIDLSRLTFVFGAQTKTEENESCFLQSTQPVGLLNTAVFEFRNCAGVER
jgi:hypothetical protein